MHAIVQRKTRRAGCGGDIYEGEILARALHNWPREKENIELTYIKRSAIHALYPSLRAHDQVKEIRMMRDKITERHDKITQNPRRERASIARRRLERGSGRTS